MQSAMKNGKGRDRLKHLATFLRQFVFQNCSVFSLTFSTPAKTVLHTLTYKHIYRRAETSYPRMKSALSGVCPALRRMKSIRRLRRVSNG